MYSLVKVKKLFLFSILIFISSHTAAAAAGVEGGAGAMPHAGRVENRGPKSVSSIALERKLEYIQLLWNSSKEGDRAEALPLLRKLASNIWAPDQWKAVTLLKESSEKSDKIAVLMAICDSAKLLKHLHRKEAIEEMFAALKDPACKTKEYKEVHDELLRTLREFAQDSTDSERKTIAGKLAVL